MANENGKTPTQAQPQMIPLSKIHELPGVFNPKPQDKSLGSMVLSIESSGIKEPVILRQRDDGEYQLLSSYPAILFLTMKITATVRTGIIPNIKTFHQ